MRKVISIKDCMKTFEGDGIPVTRAFPVPGMREVDPFLLFDHFGPINYEPDGATGVPAHPHCGFEAITYLLDGEIMHCDSWGGKATIKTGDMQWMTTGSGLIHSELVTDNFKKSGGVMQGLQIWVNLPKKNKKAKPGYQHILQDKIPTITMEDKSVNIKILVGEFMGQSSLVNTYSPVSIFDAQFKEPDEFSFSISNEQIAMVYIIEGKLKLQYTETIATKGQMVFYDQSSDILHLNSLSQYGSYLVLAGKPLNEPVARYGPFITNTQNEIQQALLDYQSGKMGYLH